MGGEKCKTMMGIELLVFGVLIWLNDVNSWLSWGQFVGLIVVLKGLIMLFSKACSMGECAPMPAAKKKRRR